MYSHTLPSHHPGRHPPNSGSSHPDTRGRGRTATPRHPAPTQPLRRCAKPTPVVDSRLLLFIIPLASHHPARRRSRPASNTRRHAGCRLETACQEALLQDICTATRRWVNRCAGTLVTSAWITVMWLGTPELRPRPGSRAGQRSSLNHRQHRGHLPHWWTKVNRPQQITLGVCVPSARERAPETVSSTAHTALQKTFRSTGCGHASG